MLEIARMSPRDQNALRSYRKGSRRLDRNVFREMKSVAFSDIRQVFAEGTFGVKLADIDPVLPRQSRSWA